MRTGHTMCHSHYNRFRKEKDKEQCRYCKKHDETPEHILLYCTHFHPVDWSIRLRFKNYCDRNWKNWTFNTVVIKQDKKMIKLLGKLIVSLRSFGVVL